MFLFWWLVGSITKVSHWLVNEVCSIDGCCMLLAVFSYNVSCVKLPFGKHAVVHSYTFYMLGFE